MYAKVLVPLDGSRESEGVFGPLQNELSAETRLVLLHVIPPARTRTVDGRVMLGVRREEAERNRAESYLRGVADRVAGEADRWRCEVAVSPSVPQGIVDCARWHDVDLIAMYTHDRKGVARIIRGSVAREVEGLAPIEVKVFKPREVASAI